MLAICFSLTFLSFPILVNAQPDPGSDPDAPIDGGIGILLAAGVGYGIKKYHDYKKENNKADI
jgi:hypothetical protein